MKNILLSFLLLFNFNSFATHLVGGEVVYSCLGGNQYEIKVIIYRECGPTNTNGTGFDGTGVITIYDANNNEVFVLQHEVAEEEFIVDEFTDECLTLPPELCVEKGTYTVIANLPNNGQGYKVVYQRCCRNEQLINIDEPQDVGSSLVAIIPPIAGLACNNSPSFDSFPPLALCLGSDVSVSQSATDVDGDSLVYSLVAPFHGSSNNDPTGTYPPPYNQIPWADGYSEEYPMDSNPVLSIDSNSGLITGTPTQEGFYVIGIMVEEYRNGVYLGEILRDFRFLVIDCSSNGCGCTVENALNYDDDAIDDDGSCEFDGEVIGCSDIDAINFNPYSTFDDGSCVNEILGCMDSLAFNFDGEANTQGECYYWPCQPVNIPSGWSMFSTYISADQMNISTVLNPIIDNVELVKDNNGNPYFVEWGYNSLGDLQIGQGYQIKTNASVILEICGDYAYPQDHPIELTAGWNMIGYLRLEPAATDAVLSDVLPELILVKDYLGAAYLPDFNYNGIGDMIPGQGYHLKVSNETILYFHSNEEPYRTSIFDVIDTKTSHYNSVKATDNNMTIIIDDHAWDILPSANSEISAFDNSGIMVGSTRYTSPVTVLTLWGDDHTNESKVGLANFEASNFELWSEGDVKSFNIEKWSVGSNRYEVNAVNIAESISVTNTNEAELAHKKRLRTINVLGQEVNSNDYGYQAELLFDLYNDGSVEKRVRIKSKK